MPMVATLLYLSVRATQSPNGCMGWLVVQPVRTIQRAGLRWVRSSAAMTGKAVGMRWPSTKGWSAYPVDARSPPVRTCTRSWSTSLRALVRAVAGVPSLSSTISSILRPATWRPISSR